MRARRPFAGKRGGGQREAVSPRVNELIPKAIALKKNSTELDGPTQQVVTAGNLRVHSGRGKNTEIDLDRRRNMKRLRLGGNRNQVQVDIGNVGPDSRSNRNYRQDVFAGRYSF